MRRGYDSAFGWVWVGGWRGGEGGGQRGGAGSECLEALVEAGRGGGGAVRAVGAGAPLSEQELARAAVAHAGPPG